MIAGLKLLDPQSAAANPGSWTLLVAEGSRVEPGQPLVEVEGIAPELAVAEDHVLGPLGWASGIATRCSDIVAGTPEGLRVVCGGWKKLPAALKPLLRAGLEAGGVGPRLLEGEFVYVDKNSLRLLGSTTQAVTAGRDVDHGPVAVQARTPEAALEAARAGAGAIMVDSTSLEVLRAVNQALAGAGLRENLVLAFGGGVTSARLADVARAGAEIVDIGREILDAPLLDLRFDVVTRGGDA